MLAVVTFLYGGWRKSTYGITHVHALRRMMETHLTIPHRFVCISDRDIPGIEVYPMWDFPEVKVRPGDPNNWKCLPLFGMAHELGEKVLCSDLDILIRGNIDHLITDDPFAIVKGKAAPYGSCLYQFDTDRYKHIWESFDPVEAPRIIAQKRHPDGRRWIGSDQAWISHCVPNAVTWGPAEGIYRYKSVRGKPLADEVKVVNWGGAPKPWQQKRDPLAKWTYHEYMTYMEERP